MAKFSFKIVSFLLFLVVAVQAQDFFQGSEDQTSAVLSESGESNDLGVTLPNMEFPREPESNSVETSSLSSEPESFDQGFEETNLPFETQEESHPEETSESSSELSAFPQVSVEGTAEPLKKSHHTPPPLPSPPKKAPYPPKRPLNSCGKNCATKCSTKKVPILGNLCTKICRQKCVLLHVQAIYKCTVQCAESMPKNFKSDKNKATGYVKYCYNKCVSKV